jgi:hypothetical protein
MHFIFPAEIIGDSSHPVAGGRRILEDGWVSAMMDGYGYS